MKVLRPFALNEFADTVEESEILCLMANFLPILRSAELVGLDDRHTLKWYAWFLVGLLGRWRLQSPSAGLSSSCFSLLSSLTAVSSVASTACDGEGPVMLSGLWHRWWDDDGGKAMRSKVLLLGP